MSAPSGRLLLNQGFQPLDKKARPAILRDGLFCKVGGFLYVVVEHHRHHKHQDILVGILGCRHDQACTVGRRELQAYFLARKVVQHLYQKLRIEANFDILSIMVARQTLVRFIREVQIFRRDHQLATGQLQANLVCGLVGIDRNTSQGTQ